MHLKSDYILREIAGENVAIPVGKTLNLNTMITLNDTGVFLWRLLENETTEEAMVASLLDEYDVDAENARVHVVAFVAKLKEHDFLA